jgi:hypothetical protein
MEALTMYPIIPLELGGAAAEVLLYTISAAGAIMGVLLNLRA